MLKPKVIVIDSIQTIASENLESAPGTLSQIRDVTHDVIQRAKADGSVAILVGHVTKEGQIAGPRLLEHMVDAVFYFENANNSPYRMLRAQKNRFGPTNELAVFEMGSKGLEEVLNPSERFLEERASEMPGSAIVAQLEGTRPFLNEVQALVQNSYQGFPRRTNQGVDQNLSLIHI